MNETRTDATPDFIDTMTAARLIGFANVSDPYASLKRLRVNGMLEGVRVSHKRYVYTRQQIEDCKKRMLEEGDRRRKNREARRLKI